MAGTHRFETARSYESPARLDDLVARIGRLAIHRGFEQDRIASPMLKALMPRERISLRGPFESSLRQRLEKAGLDANRLAYLSGSVDAELGMAHERTT